MECFLTVHLYENNFSKNVEVNGKKYHIFRFPESSVYENYTFVINSELVKKYKDNRDYVYVRLPDDYKVEISKIRKYRGKTVKDSRVILWRELYDCFEEQKNIVYEIRKNILKAHDILTAHEDMTVEILSKKARIVCMVEDEEIYLYCVEDDYITFKTTFNKIEDFISVSISYLELPFVLLVHYSSTKWDSETAKKMNEYFTDAPLINKGVIAKIAMLPLSSENMKNLIELNLTSEQLDFFFQSTKIGFATYMQFEEAYKLRWKKLGNSKLQILYQEYLKLKDDLQKRGAIEYEKEERKELNEIRRNLP